VTRAPDLGAILEQHQLVCVLGPGGVGKTTLAASLALLSSQERRTLVVTIDPAKRLASALSLELGHEVSRVRKDLDAVMVDTKHALDDLLRRYAPSPDSLDEIFRSPFYQQLSSALVGSEEFAAMGLLHEYATTDEYDLIVVDTPPSRHALDFLTVNERLIKVFTSGLTQLVFKPGRLFSVAGGRMAGVLARWTSREYLATVSDFMLQFEDLFLDMEERVRHMDALLRDPQRTSLGIVAVPEPGTVREALSLAQGVRELGLEIDVAFANRVYPPLASGTSSDERAPLLEHYRQLAAMHRQGIEALANELGPPVIIPALPHVTGLAGLEQIVPALARSGAIAY